MSEATDNEIQKLKFALLEAESRRQRAHKAEVEAEVDICVLREKLKRAENGQAQQQEAHR